MKSRLILIVTLGVLVLGIGSAVVWWTWLRPSEPALVQEAEPQPSETTGPLVIELPTEAPPTPRPTRILVEEAEETNQEAIEGCITIRVLNARIGPGREFPAAGGLGKGECVPFDARSSDNRWLRVMGRVAERGDRLWASADFIQLVEDINLLPVEE